MGVSHRVSRELESLVLGQGADAVGFAPVERFAEAPEGTGPRDYLPDAECVVSIGMHIQDGICDVWGEYTQPGKTIAPYLFFGYGLTNLELSRIANNAAKRLEYEGFKSFAFPPTWAIGSYRSLGTDNDAWRADFSHRHAAVAAGLGEFGRSGLVLTPVYGSRMRFISILTSAPLTPTPLYDGPPLCQPERCGDRCTRVCPTNAFDFDDRREVHMEGHTFSYLKADVHRCSYGVLGYAKGSGAINGIDIPPPDDDGMQGNGADFEWLENLPDQRRGPDWLLRQSCFGIICGDFCGKCLHQCPAHQYSREAEAAPAR